MTRTFAHVMEMDMMMTRPGSAHPCARTGRL
jgi:hypothetical protein